VLALKWMYVAFGLLLILMSVPFLAQKIKPNPFYGFRTARTLNDPAIWYKANAYAARMIVGIGMFVVMLAWTLGESHLSHRAYGAALGAVLLLGMSFAVALSYWHIRRL